MSKVEAYLRDRYDGEINMTHFAVEGDTLLMVFKKSKSKYFQDILSQLKTLFYTQPSLNLNIITIYELILVNPATALTAERLFLSARRIKHGIV